MLNKKLGVFAIAAISVLAIGVFTTLNAEDNFTFSTPDDGTLFTYSASLADKKYPVRSIAAMYGEDVTEMSQALTRSTVDAKEPTLLPKEIELKKTMTEGTTDAKSNMITTIYGPTSIDYSEFTTFSQLLDHKGIIIIQTNEDKDYDRDAWMNAYANQIGDTANILSINGKKIIAIEGNPQEGLTSEIIYHKGRIQIDILSVAYNVEDLLKIASTL